MCVSVWLVGSVVLSPCFLVPLIIIVVVVAAVCYYCCYYCYYDFLFLNFFLASEKYFIAVVDQ